MPAVVYRGRISGELARKLASWFVTIIPVVRPDPSSCLMIERSSICFDCPGIVDEVDNRSARNLKTSRLPTRMDRSMKLKIQYATNQGHELAVKLILPDARYDGFEVMIVG
jgi:hypothetical protein